MNNPPPTAPSGWGAPAGNADYNQLQEKLVPLWKQIGRIDPGGPLEEANTIVVVTSLPAEASVPVNKLRAYEQRFLFMLFLLRQPNIRLIYVTSQPVDPLIVDYYLDTIPGVIISNARKRLFLVDVGDSGPEALAQKLLDRPRVLANLRALIPNPDMAHIVPFVTTELERALALQLGIPLYGSDPQYTNCGTKSGGRRIFEAEGVPYPLGYEDLYSEAALVEAICQIRAQKPALKTIIVKLNEGAGGVGNAMVDLQSLPPSGDAGEQAAVLATLREMKFEEATVAYQDYLAGVEQNGAIIEELISGRAIRSPSAQLRITPLGEVEMLSTHDQILGGPSGQIYLGARFPADKGYVWPIMAAAQKIGQRLAAEGVIGRFAVDFVVVQTDDGAWHPYAIEINLRKGGTTAPFLTLQYLTDGKYYPDEGVFKTHMGAEKHYVSSDRVESPAYRMFTPDMLLDVVSQYRLHFDQTTHTGIVLHMFCDIGSSGMTGVTAIGNTPAEADALYQRFVQMLDQETKMGVTV